MSELPEGFGADKISLALKQQANEREQIALLTKENTELKAQIERDKEPVKALYDEANELRTELERVKADRNRQGILAITEAFKMCDELRAKLERVEESNKEIAYKSFHEIADLTSRAERAEAAGAEMRKSLEWFGCETCNGSEVFTFECQGCITGEGECTCANEQPGPCPQCQSIPDIKAQYDTRKHALSTQCGASWLSPEKAGRLRELIKNLRALVPIRPRAISYDDGWVILDHVQDVFLPQAEQALAETEAK